MIGIISQLEELDFPEVRKEIQKANAWISTSTAVAVLEGILEHVYYDPIQAVREERMKEVCYPLIESYISWLTPCRRIQIKTMKATFAKMRRVQKSNPTAQGQEMRDLRE